MKWSLTLCAALFSATVLAAVAGDAAAPQAWPRAELLSLATWPADSFASGPPSGQFDDTGERLPAARFPSQPVQGISSIKPGPERDTWWALADNGYGTRANSPDWRLAIYLLAASPQRPAVALLRRIELTDPDARFPWRLSNEELPRRPLTGSDIDPESFVVMPDGSFWISDEFGPWLLHFDAQGRLLSRPVDLPDPRDGHSNQVLRSPQHPSVLSGRAAAQLRSSRGLEGLASAADGSHLFALLEGSVEGDAAAELRLFEFDTATGQFTGRHWRYAMDASDHSVGELAAGNDGQLLAIERDSLQGEAARFKKIYRLAAPTAATANGAVLGKKLAVDLLHIADPRRIASTTGEFRYPWLTIEAVQSLAPDRLLVVNDNNYPATGGRGKDVRDLTEWVWLKIQP